MTTELPYRFPGAKPFSVEDRDVFHGREQDIDSLFELLRMKRLLILYAQSGIGKSSLVNAGLLPKCNYVAAGHESRAVRIRFGLPQETDQEREALAAKVTRELEREMQKSAPAYTGIPFAGDGEANGLWHVLKHFERNKIHLLLVFDQAEEMFAYRKDQIEFLKEQLFSLFSGVPRQLDAAITRRINLLDEGAGDPAALARLDKDLAFIYAPLATQVLFVIREDKLGFFGSFTDFFPDILKNTYRLLPLSEPAARDAIVLPAGKEAAFETPPFRFSGDALEKLLATLAEKEKGDTYDPFTIQLTCRYIEKTLVKDKGKREIEEADIPEVGVIVNHYIESVWSALALKVELNRPIDAYKDTVAQKLIAHDIERRVSVHEGGWLEEEVVNFLVSEGLLKEDPRGGVEYIELSHDRLITPILEEYTNRKGKEKLNRQKERERLSWVAGLAVLVISIGAMFLLNRLDREESRQKSDVQDTVITDLRIEAQETIKRLYYESSGLYLELAKKAMLAQEYDTADSLFKLATNAEQSARELEWKDSVVNKQQGPETPASRSPAGAGQAQAENPDFQAPRPGPTAVNADVGTVNSRLIFRIDVFYDERTRKKSEATADLIVADLRKNPAYIVNKKLLTEAVTSRKSTYNIQRNTIRYERDAEEKALAERLIKELNASGYIKGGRRLFRGEQVRSGFRSPNYISIFVRW